jgi:hypothetical protein
MPEDNENMAIGPNPGEGSHNPAGSSAPPSPPSSAAGVTPALPTSIEPAAPPTPPDAMIEPMNVAAPVQPEPPSRVDVVIEAINAIHGKSVESVIKTGEIFSRAKKELLHGEWISMFECTKLELGLRSAQMHMRIAEHPVLSLAKYFSYLPASLTVLYALSGLPAEIVEEAITGGVIHGELKMSDVRQLKDALGDGLTALKHPTPPPFDLGRQQKHLLDYLRRQAQRWPAAHQLDLAVLLESFAGDIRAGGTVP